MKIMIITKNMRAGGAERVISQLLKEWTLVCFCLCIMRIKL